MESKRTFIERSSDIQVFDRNFRDRLVFAKYCFSPQLD